MSVTEQRQKRSDQKTLFQRNQILGRVFGTRLGDAVPARAAAAADLRRDFPGGLERLLRTQCPTFY